MEIVELYHKLSESHPSAKIPSPPLDISSLPPPKRKSTFLNTLSRLASPTSAKSGRHSRPSRQPTPLVSPSFESSDPFLDDATPMDTNGVQTNGSFTVTSLAAYLTTISNTPVVRQARVWQRFVRVRTDDLESVRVERAIKRRCSDLASHVSPKVPSEQPKVTQGDEENVQGDDAEHDTTTERGECGVPEGPTREQNDDDAALQEDAAIARAIVEDLLQDIDVARSTKTSEKTKTINPAPLATASALVDGVDDDDDDTHISTPVATDHPANRRSQSADPHKSSRLSRAYVSRTSIIDEASSQTGDESSVSMDNNMRTLLKKRYHSSERIRQPKKSQRKVAIDDFEMMRVLGKGCAGKVLLVRHKSTSSLYALKAITKRHVLAHQELQHTLTEQAVLKRMAAESKDPFVVKLWWSFHDKENLFLVMVRCSFVPTCLADPYLGLSSWG